MISTIKFTKRSEREDEGNLESGVQSEDLKPGKNEDGTE